MRKVQIAVLFILIHVVAGCAGPQPVATDVQTVDKPVKTRCTIKWPKKPTPHVANVQLSGNDALDAVLVERAKEAELEEHRAYQLLLDAAAGECVEPL